MASPAPLLAPSPPPPPPPTATAFSSESSFLGSSEQSPHTTATSEPTAAVAESTSPPFTATSPSENEGCRVYSRPSPEDDGPINGPEEPETVSRCEYRATVAAGYEGSGTWTLDVIRGGQTISLNSVTSPPCMGPGVIQPGDLVRAQLGLNASYQTPVRASAGTGEWHLQVTPWVRC